MLTTILIFVVGMAQQDWYVFEPEGKNFRVELPTKPGDTSTRAVNNAAGGSRLTAAQLMMPDGVYLLQVTESRGKVDPKTLDEGIRRFAASTQAVLGTVTPIKIDGYPGCEFEMTESSDRGQMHSKRRWVVSGNLLFMLSAIGRPGSNAPASADRFLGSLEIGNAKRAVRTPAPDPTDTPAPITVVETDDTEPMTKEADAGEDKDKAKDASKPSAPAPKPKALAKIIVSRVSRNTKSYPAEDLQDLPRSFTDSESFRDVGPAGSVLVGVRVTYIEHFGGPKIRSAQPIYRSASGKNHYVGQIHGEVVGPVVTVVAGQGYAVGGLITHTGLTVDGFRMVFMKIDGDHLDPNDSYNSPWLGDLKGGGPGEVFSPGGLIVGLQGRSRNEIFALGLSMLVETRARSGDSSARSDEPKDKGPSGKSVGPAVSLSQIPRNAKNYPTEDLQDLPRSFDSEREGFRDVGPAGSVLVGVRVSYIDHGGPKVRSAQPIYRLGKNHYVGQIHGEVIGPVTTIVAKPGYAVGGLVTHAGLTVDGFRMVFMKIEGDHLDPNDSYNSPWLGDLNGGGPGEVSSQGEKVVGLQGRSRNEVFALGLTALK
jgi:hypothetical protein